MFGCFAAGVDDLQFCTARLGCGQHGLQAFVVAWADDGGVVGVACKGGKQLCHSLGIGMAERGFFAFGQQHVVRCYAGLPCVQQLAMRDFDGGCIHVAAGVNDARRLAAQLQCGGGQVSGGSFGDDAAHSGRAGKKQMIKRQA